MKTRRERKKKNLYYEISSKPKYGTATVVWRGYLTSFYILPQTKNRNVGKVTFSSEIR